MEKDGSAIENRGASRAAMARAAGVNKGNSILLFILRLVALIGTLTLLFFTRFIRLKVQYDDMQSFTFLVIANSLVSGYLVLSLPVSIFHIIRSRARAAGLSCCSSTRSIANTYYCRCIGGGSKCTLRTKGMADPIGLLYANMSLIHSANAFLGL